MLSAHDLLPLPMLAAGGTGQVAQVCGDAHFVHRLRELGLHDGCEVEMVRPGNPCIIRLGSQKLCLRGDDVATVLVSVVR